MVYDWINIDALDKINHIILYHPNQVTIFGITDISVIRDGLWLN